MKFGDSDGWLAASEEERSPRQAYLREVFESDDQLFGLFEPTLRDAHLSEQRAGVNAPRPVSAGLDRCQGGQQGLLGLLRLLPVSLGDARTAHPNFPNRPRRAGYELVRIDDNHSMGLERTAASHQPPFVVCPRRRLNDSLFQVLLGYRKNGRNLFAHNSGREERGLG